MSIPNTFIPVDSKIVGTNIKVEFGYDAKNKFQPLLLLSKAGRKCCLLSFPDLKSIYCLKNVIQKIMEHKIAAKTVFVFNEVKLVFFTNVNNKFRVKLVGRSGGYPSRTTPLRSMIMKPAELILLHKSYRKLNNFLSKYFNFTRSIQSDFMRHLENVSVLHCDGSEHYFAELHAYCNGIVLENSTGENKKRFEHFKLSYYGVMPYVLYNYYSKIDL